MTRILAIAVVVAQLLDVATWMAMPRAAELNPLAQDLHSTNAWLLKAALVLLAVAVGVAARNAPPAKYSVVTSLSRGAGELVAVLAIAAGCLGAGSNLAVISFVSAVEAPRSAPEPAPIASDATGIEQGDVAPAAPARIPAPHAVPRGTLRGNASWYPAPGSVAAAGPALRRALGPGWRGTWVRVVAGDRSVTVRLDDWCQCYRGTSAERLVDLSDDDFAVLSPLVVGVVRVRIALIVPPPTDTVPRGTR